MDLGSVPISWIDPWLSTSHPCPVSFCSWLGSQYRPWAWFTTCLAWGCWWTCTAWAHLTPVFQDSLTFSGLSLGDPPWHFLQTHNWVPKVASFDALGQLLTGIKAVWSSKYHAAVTNKLFPPLIIGQNWQADFFLPWKKEWLSKFDEKWDQSSSVTGISVGFRNYQNLGHSYSWSGRRNRTGNIRNTEGGEFFPGFKQGLLHSPGSKLLSF